MTTEEIVQYRVDLGWSQQRFADEIGVTVDVVRSLERGRRPNLQNSVAVAKFFDSTPTEFFGPVTSDAKAVIVP